MLISVVLLIYIYLYLVSFKRIEVNLILLLVGIPSQCLGRPEKVSSFDSDTVGFSFRDGTEAIGSIAFGCDGSHS
jgi:hypothetical protein